MSEHAKPVHSAKLLLPVVIIGMLCLMMIMFYAGGNAGVSEYNARGADTHQSAGGH